MKISRVLLFLTIVLFSFSMGQAQSAQTWQTGQTTSYATGDDGDLQRGVRWPDLRFEDNADGTVTDHLTGLVWLKNANCGGSMNWDDALTYCNNLASGSCGLTDGSVVGDWRLPNRKELLSLVDYSRSHPALPQSHLFDNVQSSYYWSSTAHAYDTNYASSVSMCFGSVGGYYKSYGYYVWPVRGGKGGSFENLTISNPNGGESLLKGQDYTITWDSVNVSGNIQIDLYKGGTEPENMLMQLAASTENDGEYLFNPPDSLADGNDYLIGISADQGMVWDFIDTYFTIQTGSYERDSVYFPHIASNRKWETEICIINTSSEQNLSGDLKAYNNSGQEVSSTPIILGSNGRREIIIGDELPNPSDIGYIIFESDSENVCGYTKLYTEGKYRVAVPAVSDINAGDIYLSHIASNTNWWTEISILNTTSSSKELTVEFDNETTKSITIAAKEHRAFTINSLFGGEPQPNINSAVIKNGSGIVGLELFGSSDNSGDNYLSGILLEDETTTHIYYPQIASDSTWWTGILAYNPSITSCTLNITPFRDDGTFLPPQTILLAGQKKYMGMVQDLDLPEGTAWFRIIATGPITGFELFGTNDRKQLSGYTGVGISRTDGVFAKTEKDGWTGIAFVNIENFPATVKMTAYDDIGNVIDTETLNVNAYTKVVDVAQNLFSQDISNATYISYSSDGEVVGFQVNGSSDDMMLDALPGM
jgi:Protein of unknown function (DUF1566)/Kre9/KNH-like N-terminal Ig-like domain